PDEQHDQRADGGGDEAGALVRAVMADGLTDPGRQERAGNAEHGGQDKAARIVRARGKHPRDDAGDKADDDDPDNAAHGGGPFTGFTLTNDSWLRVRSGLTIRSRS